MKLVTRGMSPGEWLIRTMILESDRRNAVMAGRPDPNPGAEWRICAPDELLDYRKAHPSKIDGMAAATKRDRYGMKGVA